MDGFRYQLFWMYIALLIGMWIAINTEDDDVVVDYTPLWIVAVIWVFAGAAVIANLTDCTEATAVEMNLDVKDAKDSTAAMPKDDLGMCIRIAVEIDLFKTGDGSVVHTCMDITWR